MNAAIIFTDGASKGNPGQASIGVSILEGDTEVATISEAIGLATNNIAEYTALLEGLRKVKELGYKEITVKADSELMIKQLKGEYKVKNPDIKVIYLQLQELIKAFDSISFNHVRREFNTRADQLANLAL